MLPDQHADEGPQELEVTPSEEAQIEREPFWGYSDLALVIGLVVAAFALIVVGFGAVAAAFPKIKDNLGVVAMPMQILVYLAVYGIFWFTLTARYGKPVMKSLGWKRPRINLLIVGFSGVVLAFVISIMGTLFKTPKIESPFSEITDTPLNLAMFAVVAVALAPFFEEMFFRGFIQPLLSRSFGAVTGIVSTALLFGLLHAPEYHGVWQYAFFITVVGIVFGWLRVKTDSLIPSTVMHGCFNAVSVVALAFGKNI